MPIISKSSLTRYVSGESSFIAGLLPADALLLPDRAVIELLRQRLGDQFDAIFDPENRVSSPVLGKMDGKWLKNANIVGINVRTIGSFWNLIKYNLTLSDTQNSIHLLPIWEPGVVASLYGMSSWNINSEFFSPQLHAILPHLDTVERQLQVCINIFHAFGKTVGMDVIPHTDRFSEQVLANPRLFEWLRRRDTEILEHGNELYKTVENLLFDLARTRTDVSHDLPKTAELFFSPQFPESLRAKILFGKTTDFWQRLKNRAEIIEILYQNGLESVPATMGPPYRGLKIDERESAVTIDEKGRVWRDFLITKPQVFSRVFNPLTRYKLYENKNDNQNWEMDFDQPLAEAWHYVADHYAHVQAKFGFDFMRGDMAHVQPRPKLLKKRNGKVPPQYQTEFYDILGFIKQKVAKNAPYFASYAETFLAQPNQMLYGDECDHLEYAHADATLGDLQSMIVGSKRFVEELNRYIDIAQKRDFAPCFTMMTADKDDPRFDEFYVGGNEARFFFGTFVTDLPSYVGLGFECRDAHFSPVANEFYTKLYVFLEKTGEKAVKSAYQFGKNEFLFENLEAIKGYADEIGDQLENAKTEWLVRPTVEIPVAVWTQIDAPNFIFIVNFDIKNNFENLKIPFKTSKNAPPQYRFDFSTIDDHAQPDLAVEKTGFVLAYVRAGEGLAFRQH